MACQTEDYACAVFLGGFTSYLRNGWSVNLRASAPPPPLPSARYLSFSVFLRAGDRAYRREGGGEGWGRSQNIQRRESLALYKSLNTHWVDPNHSTEKSLPSVLNLNLLLGCEHISARNKSSCFIALFQLVYIWKIIVNIRKSFVLKNSHVQY